MQEVAVTPGKLVADADLIDYTLGASEKDEGTRFAVLRRGRGVGSGSRKGVDWCGLPCEWRFWERKLGSAKAYYLWWFTASEEPHI